MGKEGQGKDDFYFDIKDPEIATLDRKTGEITGLEEGETTVRNIILKTGIYKHFYRLSIRASYYLSILI